MGKDVFITNALTPKTVLRAEAKVLLRELKIKKRQAKLQKIKHVQRKFKTSTAGRISIEIKRLLFKKNKRRRRR